MLLERQDETVLSSKGKRKASKAQPPLYRDDQHCIGTVIIHTEILVVIVNVNSMQLLSIVVVVHGS